MSAKVIGLIFDSGLKPLPRLVLLALADRGSSDGRNIYPSVKEVASMTGLSPRSVKRALLTMREDRMLIVEERASHHSPNRYRINLKMLTARVKRKVEDDEPDTAPIKTPKTSWLTPFDDVWHQRFGGHLSFGRAAASLKPVCDEHGMEKAVAGFQKYCDGNEARYAKVEDFASKAGAWINGHLKPTDTRKGRLT